ncbi:hypothetical protein IAT38_005903 [Cryptococcus sp. DSM 104549]
MSAPVASTSKPKGPKPVVKVPAPLPASFSAAQAEKAVNALLAHHAKVAAKKEEEELLPREEHVWVVVNTKHGSTRKSLMPVKIQLPHPALPPPPATSICLLTKSPQRTYKDLLAEHNIKFIARVVGVEKLKGKFRPYEARRELMRDHEMFLCDERVVPMMPKLLGKMFFEAKKQPIPVNLLRKDLKAELGRAISSTFFHPTTGTSTTTRLSTPFSTTPAQTLANLLASLPLIVANIQGGWDNVLSVGLKTSSSVMLPVWSSKLGGRFDAAPASAGKAGKGKKADEMEVEEEAVPEPVKAVEVAPPKAEKKVKSKVAAAEEKPKKKSSTVGSGAGGAGKRSKVAAVGAGKPKARK